MTTVALPNLIAPDLVLVHPMSSMSGYVTYIQYVSGSNKGNIAQGDVFNDPFRLGKVDPNFTSNTVATDLNLTEATTAFGMKWTPVIPGSVVITNGTDRYVDDGNGKIFKNPTAVSRRTVFDEVVDDNPGTLRGAPGRVEVTITGGTEAGTVVYTGATAGITLTDGITGAATVQYVYNNINIPQNDLPILSARMQSLALTAKARRIAIYYSQIAAFQAKTDYGMDLGAQLAEKAVGELAYEIDTEIVGKLVEAAGEPDPDLVWNKALPIGVSKRDHYAGFAETVGLAKQKIYDLTKRFAPNYMIASSAVLPILGFVDSFKAASTTNVNGPYFAGTFDGLKVYVSPNIPAGQFAIGVNGDDFMTSVAVYAPYMPIVPTQLLGYADGGMSQGWSTLYDLKILNKDLIVAGAIVNEERMSSEVVKTAVQGTVTTAAA